MMVQQLLVEAETAERLAALVSYEPDKRKLRQQAARLRQEAIRLKGEGKACESARPSACR
jgi:hypothetical protein